MMFTLPPIVENYLEMLGDYNIVGVVCNASSCIVANAYKYAYPQWNYISFDESGLEYVDEHGLCQHLPADPDLVTIMKLFDYSGDGGEVKSKEDWQQAVEYAVFLKLSELFETVRAVVTPSPDGGLYECYNY